MPGKTIPTVSANTGGHNLQESVERVVEENRIDLHETQSLLVLFFLAAVTSAFWQLRSNTKVTWVGFFSTAATSGLLAVCALAWLHGELSEYKALACAIAIGISGEMVLKVVMSHGPRIVTSMIRSLFRLPPQQDPPDTDKK